MILHSKMKILLLKTDDFRTAALREATGVPIMVDESLWDPTECAVVLQAGAADVANVYIAESGGILKAATNLRMCEAAGITGLIGAMPGLHLK